MEHIDVIERKLFKPDNTGMVSLHIIRDDPMKRLSGTLDGKEIFRIEASNDGTLNLTVILGDVNVSLPSK